MDRLTRDMIQAIPMPALLVDRMERIAACNDAAHGLLGDRIEGLNFAMVLRQPQVIAAIEAALFQSEGRTVRHISVEGGNETAHEVTCRPVHGPDGRMAMLVFRDVSDLEQASEMRRDFVANVSHELRTPLTALMGFIETLRGPARDDAAARERFLGIMEAEAARMNRLVTDLLSLNRVESEERLRPSDPVDLGAVAGSMLKSLEPLAQDAGVELRLAAPQEPVVVPGDADQLRQVLTNLVENAIKYGGSGGEVTVTVEPSDREPAVRGPAARIEVSDKGPGIAPHHLPRLTERFYRADSHRSRQLGGTGLGLAIVKHIVNRHRGRLLARSRPGEGAVFTVILPR